ncbi:MAG: hypothetical protein ACRDTF_07075 [Pseudonocardiaceae bacterium]
MLSGPAPRRALPVLRSQAAIQGLSRRRYRRNPTGPATEDDLVQRNFTVVATDQVWLTAITEHPTKAIGCVGGSGQGRARPWAV